LFAPSLTIARGRVGEYNEMQKDAHKRWEGCGSKGTPGLGKPGTLVRPEPELCDSDDKSEEEEGRRRKTDLQTNK